MGEVLVETVKPGNPKLSQSESIGNLTFYALPFKLVLLTHPYILQQEGSYDHAEYFLY